MRRTSCDIMVMPMTRPGGKVLGAVLPSSWFPKFRGDEYQIQKVRESFSWREP
jgi:hypothetical protein